MNIYQIFRLLFFIPTHIADSYTPKRRRHNKSATTCALYAKSSKVVLKLCERNIVFFLFLFFTDNLDTSMVVLCVTFSSLIE